MDEQTLNEIVARNAIHEVLTRYCRALDRLDEPMLRSCFHPDSQHNHGFVGPTEQFFGYAWQVLQGCVATHHQLGAVSIAVHGDTADSEAYFTAYHRLSDTPPAAFGLDAAGYDLTVSGRYVDAFEKRDGEWRIVRRTGVHDWRRFEPPADRDFFRLPPEGRGRRDKQDPVYIRRSLGG